MSARVWTCRGCGTQHPRVTQKCPCGRRRPARQRPKHQLALELPYESWVATFGERCALCDRPPATTALHRDHDHATGLPRGLLCHRCNRALPSWVTAAWLERAAVYVARGGRDLRVAS